MEGPLAEVFLSFKMFSLLVNDHNVLPDQGIVIKHLHITDNRPYTAAQKSIKMTNINFCPLKH